ncbi:phosphoesterase [Leptospira stimsonii]|uniref:Phosphoesterase n=1 Tax=Leptospira stimsonii TaxID=2202203 RepID=A0ABY2MV47_9LEPT|nr:phosphoesterase [Leptospira stimsonii]TGK25368.1 phosphoesterase [Leptospira stimsonii]TGM08787.1 phosphoesterase [Leptospira stimsonii]
MVFKKRMDPKIWFRILGFLLFLGVGHFFISWLLRSPLRSERMIPFHGNFIHSPYLKTEQRWLKTALHLHSDRDGFSPFRSSPKEIQNRYLEKKYDLIAITDYLKVSGVESGDKKFLPGYEWGRDFNRKHLLALGAETAIFDYFPIYATIGNLQWTIDQMQKEGSFVVVSHPVLEGSISYRDIERLRNVDAVEVFSPFGDSFSEWIRLLDQGYPILATSGDDLHYFPGELIRAMKLPLYERIFHELTFSNQNEGDAFTRYILLNADSNEPKEIIRNLKMGNYISVIKLVEYMDDPKISDLRMEGEKIVAEFPEKFLKLEFIGKGGRVLKEEFQAIRGEYVFDSKEEYVIMKATFPSGYLFSNPFFRVKSPEEGKKK